MPTRAPKRISTRSLHNGDMKKVVFILDGFPVNPTEDTVAKYRKQTKNDIKDLPRRLRHLTFSFSSTTLCSCHKGLDPHLIQDIWAWVKHEITASIGKFVYPLIMTGVLSAEQGLQMRQLEPVPQMWQKDFSLAESAPQGHRPIDHGHRWSFQGDLCAACMLARVGSDEEILFALFAGMLGRMRSKATGIDHKRGVVAFDKIKSKRLRFVRYWLRTTRKGEAMLHDACDFGIYMKRLWKAWKEERRRSRHEEDLDAKRASLTGTTPWYEPLVEPPFDDVLPVELSHVAFSHGDRGSQREMSLGDSFQNPYVNVDLGSTAPKIEAPFDMALDNPVRNPYLNPGPGNVAFGDLVQSPYGSVAACNVAPGNLGPGSPSKNQYVNAAHGDVAHGNRSRKPIVNVTDRASRCVRWASPIRSPSIDIPRPSRPQKEEHYSAHDPKLGPAPRPDSLPKFTAAEALGIKVPRAPAPASRRDNLPKSTPTVAFAIKAPRASKYDPMAAYSDPGTPSGFMYSPCLVRKWASDETICPEDSLSQVELVPAPLRWNRAPPPPPLSIPVQANTIYSAAQAPAPRFDRPAFCGSPATQTILSYDGGDDTTPQTLKTPSHHGHYDPFETTQERERLARRYRVPNFAHVREEENWKEYARTLPAPYRSSIYSGFGTTPFYEDKYQGADEKGFEDLEDYEDIVEGPAGSGLPPSSAGLPLRSAGLTQHTHWGDLYTP